MIRVRIPIVIEMELDNASDVEDAIDQVASICYDDPNIVKTIIEDVDRDTVLTNL